MWYFFKRSRIGICQKICNNANAYTAHRSGTHTHKHNRKGHKCAQLFNQFQVIASPYIFHLVKVHCCVATEKEKCSCNFRFPFMVMLHCYRSRKYFLYSSSAFLKMGHDGSIEKGFLRLHPYF